MQRHIDRELARARIAANLRNPGAVADLPVVLRRVADAIRRTPRGEAVHWTIELPDHLNLRMDAQDLVELSGNLVDNAAKWAREHASIRLDLSNRAEGGLRAEIRLPRSLLGD